MRLVLQALRPDLETQVALHRLTGLVESELLVPLETQVLRVTLEPVLLTGAQVEPHQPTGQVSLEQLDPQETSEQAATLVTLAQPVIRAQPAVALSCPSETLSSSCSRVARVETLAPPEPVA